MSEIVVFPEQFSFDVRQQRNNPRRRLTIKNCGIMASKITISIPDTNFFTITDSQGRTITSKHTINMIPNSSEYFFIQKKSNVSIVPEDQIVISSGNKIHTIKLKPTVSMISLDDLESVASNDIQSSRSVLSDKAKATPTSTPRQQTFMSPPDSKTSNSKQSKISRIKPPSKKITHIENTTNPPKQPLHNKDADILEFTASEFEIPKTNSIKEESSSSNSDATSDVDVLEQSLHVKFALKDDSFIPRPQSLSKQINWYKKDAFNDVEEPNFSFELAMTGSKDDPIFCIDGDYYDSSGRLLSVQQGKPRAVFVTEDGYVE
ncbi:hypothetical protein GPJ56_004603 [Histomonas meleagridis]|uniref:uncharacterized protein n=1 Tax=Histomonas meleagridis TaxID=135588 RepID=UPI003559E426|nr:hypothetical protein GPJ56_004603 [Histomonas meleagridis]KAH0799772.1 hypothetical protein GO595_007493 [Histomonas meleagridis]